MIESPHQAAGFNGNGNAAGSALDILLDIELPVTLRFGRRQMSLEAILRLDTGSIVEFDRGLQDPVEVLVNDKVVARGEAVTVHGHYGVRILEIARPGERAEATPDFRVSAASVAANLGEPG